ncbi:hypothetical protein DSM43518_02069 [Mycobacterium marinum]|uniref:hypothetical protein n=1 Tax=Mycobacterium marinum TaxID=1781 RepID=UPI000CD8A19D|nr:hypothetical protein [Mycobacterium marinum]AXN50990.1 hypothetical protein CCUG20998_03588 [Mycobacterium marinum]RFZ11229.1 hypothetical protein DSM43518_02069 [Mycobacterium marinum]RFZ25413.1 hypothetical protein DSM43519_01599 [Mycobacterium marinum]RFZ28298.1 hypothetical protein DSM44344_01343 [Mycobacterium marinum]WOR03035.1 hypothetical protein QDR78_17640 [Mycobacterium marinum]
MVDRRAVDEQRTRLLQQRFSGCTLPALTIGGFSVCHHARIRMAARLIEPEWVLEALKMPSRPSGSDDKRKFVGDMAMCVVDIRTKQIITVGYGRINELGALS